MEITEKHPKKTPACPEDDIESLKKWKKDTENLIGDLEGLCRLIVLENTFSGLFHELNQPLNGINVICQSIIRDIEKDRLDTGTLSPDLAEIVSNVTRMAKKIDHMRNYFKKKGNDKTEPSDISRVVDSIFNIIGQQLKNHGIKTNVDILPDLPEIQLHPVDLEILLLTYIVHAKNSVEKTSGNNRKIEIRVDASADKKEIVTEIVFEPSENGYHVEKSGNSILFQPDMNMETKLSIWAAQNTIEKAGGRFEVSTPLGSVTRYRIILPVAHGISGV